MTPQEQIRKLAEDTFVKLETCLARWDATDTIQAAILEGVKLALAEPSFAMKQDGGIAARAADNQAFWEDVANKSWRAMSVVRLRESATGPEPLPATCPAHPDFVEPTLDQHTLLLQAYDLSVQVDRLPAHPDQTALISALTDWRQRLAVYLVTHGLLG